MIRSPVMAAVEKAKIDVDAVAPGPEIVREADGGENAKLCAEAMSG